MHTRSILRIWPLTLALLLFILVSCGSRGEHIGSYVSDANDSPKQNETSLELKENGVGLWKVGDEEVPFSWDVKNKELRVNTKSGGVIVGNFENDVIYITLPGSKTMSFKKVR